MADGEIMQVFLNILKNAKDNFKEKAIQDAKIIPRTKDIEDHLKKLVTSKVLLHPEGG